MDLVWPTRLIFLAMGEVLCYGFNLVVSSHSDSCGSEAHICIVAIKDKKMGFFILVGSIPLHHVILLKMLLRSC